MLVKWLHVSIICVSAEIFTLGGNAFGTACQFPFKFHEKWYAECTKDGRTDGQLWCATERDYDKVGKWGLCPTRGKEWKISLTWKMVWSSPLYIYNMKTESPPWLLLLNHAQKLCFLWRIKCCRPVLWPSLTFSSHGLSTQHCPLFPLFTGLSFPWHCS